MNGDKLNDENESDPLRGDPPNVDLMGLCEEGKVERVVEYMGQGVCADYGVFYVLLDSCGDSKPLQVGKSVNGFLKCSLSIRSDLAPLLCINPPGFKLRGLSLFF